MIDNESVVVDPSEPPLCVLGAVQVVTARGAIPLGRERMRALLALLAVEPGRELSIATLATDLAPNPDEPLAPSWVRTYLSRLRARLAASDGRVTIPDATERGYRVVAESTDHVELLRLAASAERLAAARDLADAARDADLALALWAGRPFGDLDLPALDLTRASLEATHRRLEELRIEVGLDLGEHDRLLPDIESAVAREPLRERRTGLLMLALYRAGRQRQALGAAHVLRRRLADAGLDVPTPTILGLERRILDHDPGLAAPVAGAGGREDPATTPLRLVTRWERAPGFVARDAELGELGESTRSGDGPVAIVVEGDPGMGKTALLGEVTARAQHDGRTVMPARCPPVANAPFEVIGRLARAVGASDLAAAVDPGAAPHDEQVLVVTEALRSALHAIADRFGPCTLVVDDAHRIDAGSAAVLSRLDVVAPPDLALVLSARPDGNQSWRSLRAALRSIVPTSTVAVGPFAEPEVAAALASRGFAADDATVAHVHHVTGGHPLLLTSLLDSGLDLEHLPESVTEWVEAQLEALPESSAEVIRTVALLGVAASVHKLAAAAGVDVDTAAEALADPGCRHLVVEALGGDVIRLRHEMVAQAVRDGLTSSAAARTHRRAMQWEDDTGGSPVQSAWHALGAAAVLGWSEVVAHVIAGARHGLGAGTFDQVVELASATERVEPTSTTELLVLHASALQELGDRSAALDLFVAALGGARDAGDITAVADIAQRVVLWAGSYRGEPQAIAVVAEAREYLKVRDPVAAARVHRAELLQEVMRHGPSPRRRAELDELPRATAADELAHRRAELYLDAGSPDPMLRLARADALRDALAEVDHVHRSVALDASFFRLAALRTAGRMSEEEAIERQRFRSLAHEARTPTFMWLDMVADYDAAQDAGELDEAVRVAIRARDYGREHRLPDSEASYIGLRFVVGLLRDDLVIEGDDGPLDLGRLFERFAQGEPDVALWSSMSALVRVRRGDGDGAETAIRRSIELIGSSEGHHLGPFSTVLAAQAACELRRPDVAVDVRVILAPYAGTFPRMGQLGATLGPADRLLGTLAAVSGDREAAIGLLEQSLDHSRRNQRRPWIALALAELAALVDEGETSRMGEEANARAADISLHLPSPIRG